MDKGEEVAPAPHRASYMYKFRKSCMTNLAAKTFLFLVKSKVK